MTVTDLERQIPLPPADPICGVVLRVGVELVAVCDSRPGHRRRAHEGPASAGAVSAYPRPPDRLVDRISWTDT